MPVSEVILISMGLLTLAIIAAGLFRRVSMPYAVVLVVIGILLGELARVWPLLSPLQSFRLSPELVFFVFLPALIFESGLSLNARQLLKDLGPVLTLAVPALLLSTSIVGITVWWLLDIDLTIALLFGALISATDPVAVIALFKELGAPMRLNVLVEGESLFNDATAIVVFGILLSMANEGTSISLFSSAGAIVAFLRVFIGGSLVGIIIGLVFSELLYRLHSSKSAVLAMSLVIAYLSFILAEHVLHVSGVMATVTAALSLSIVGLPRISLDVKPLISETWEFISLVANSMLFLLVGLSIHAIELVDHVWVIFAAVVIVLLARAVSVYSLVPITMRVFKLPTISIAERHIMWWGGLKGGLAIAIVLSIPESLPGRELLITLTLGIVLFTLMVNAWSIRSLMHFLQLDRLTEDEKSEVEQGLHQAKRVSQELVGRYQQWELLPQGLAQKLKDEIHHTFGEEEVTQNQQRKLRQVYLACLREESMTLDNLFKSGLVSQYILLDLRNNLQLDREQFHFTDVDHNPSLAKGVSIFQRLEKAVLKLIREKNWAVGLLARYQHLRLSQQIQRDIAGIILCHSVLGMLMSREDIETPYVLRLHEMYARRLIRRQQRLEDLQNDFPEKVDEVTALLFSKATYTTAQLKTSDQLEHGEIGVKACLAINKRIASLLQQINHPLVFKRQDYKSLLSMVPMFGGLPETLLTLLAGHVSEVTFLTGDIIIGEGEKGDALYIVAQGRAKVIRNNKQDESEIIGYLNINDFFGEMALLGNHTRTATVIAETSMTLIRLTRHDVLKVAAQFDDFKQLLEQVRDERLQSLENR